jgi:hypothetical protein
LFQFGIRISKLLGLNPDENPEKIKIPGLDDPTDN